MTKQPRIMHASADEIRAMRKQGKIQSDWATAEQRSPAEVERLANEDDGPLPEGWESTVEIGLPEPAQPVNIRLDAAVSRWFKARGPGYQTRINAVLRAFVRTKDPAEPHPTPQYPCPTTGGTPP